MQILQCRLTSSVGQRSTRGMKSAHGNTLHHRQGDHKSIDLSCDDIALEIPPNALTSVLVVPCRSEGHIKTIAIADVQSDMTKKNISAFSEERPMRFGMFGCLRGESLPE